MCLWGALFKASLKMKQQQTICIEEVKVYLKNLFPKRAFLAAVLDPGLTCTDPCDL